MAKVTNITKARPIESRRSVVSTSLRTLELESDGSMADWLLTVSFSLNYWWETGDHPLKGLLWVVDVLIIEFIDRCEDDLRQQPALPPMPKLELGPKCFRQLATELDNLDNFDMLKEAAITQLGQLAALWDR